MDDLSCCDEKQLIDNRKCYTGIWRCIGIMKGIFQKQKSIKELKSDIRMEERITTLLC